MSERLEPNRLLSSAEGRLRQLRRDLVLQLFMRRGSLWEAIRHVRNRWDIAVKVQLPPSVRGPLLPEGAPDFDDDDRNKYTEKYREYMDYAGLWREEMSAIRLKVVPEPYLPTVDMGEIFDYYLEQFWDKFFSACVLYDPPDDRLIEFASYGNLEPSYLSDPRILNPGNTEELPRMVYPPIKTLPGLRWAWDWYWRRILDYIREQLREKYLEPEDIERLLDYPEGSIPGLSVEYREKYRKYSDLFYIEVDNYTTQEDVRSAFQMIRAIQSPRRTKPPRGPVDRGAVRHPSRPLQ